MMQDEARFRLKPRFRGLALAAGAVGIFLLALAASGAAGAGKTYALSAGVIGAALGGGFLLSPTWRYRVLVSAEGLTVLAGRRRRLELAWSEVKRAVHSPSERTLFVDGGCPEKSLLIPGKSAPAPYDIANSSELIDFVLAHVPPGRIEMVDSLRGAE